MDENPYKAPQEQGGGPWPRHNFAAIIGVIIVVGYVAAILLALVASFVLGIFV